MDKLPAALRTAGRPPVANRARPTLQDGARVIANSPCVVSIVSLWEVDLNTVWAAPSPRRFRLLLSVTEAESLILLTADSALTAGEEAIRPRIAHST